MSLINLIWYLNVNETTKYLIFIGFFVLIMVYCLYSGKKKSNKTKKSKKTTCQKKYDACMRNNVINGTDNFCYPCFEDGGAPDFFYDSNIGQLRSYN